jgi:hypothetical protein
MSIQRCESAVFFLKGCKYYEPALILQTIHRGLRELIVPAVAPKAESQQGQQRSEHKDLELEQALGL